MRPALRTLTLTLTLTLAIALLAGCSDPPRSHDDDADVGVNNGGDDQDVGDSGGDADASLPDETHVCLDHVDPTALFQPVADGPLTQIHAALAVAPDGIWMTYNIPADDGSSLFDVWATEFGCDGTTLIPPFKVNTTVGRNDVDPTLAIHGDTAMILWPSDDQLSVHNLQAYFRTYALDGTPRMADNAHLSTTYDGEPVDATIFMTDLAAVGDSDFVVVGARGIDAAPTFQVFGQRLNADGGSIGPTFDVFWSPGTSELNPTVTGSSDGRIYVAWDESTDDSDTLHHTLIEPAGDGVTVQPAQPVVNAPAGTGSYTVGPDGAVTLAYTGFEVGDQQVILRDGGALGPTSQSVALGKAGKVDHSPTVAATAGGGAVAWFQNISGIRNDVYVQSFKRRETGGFEVGSVRKIATESPAPPYPIAFEHVAQDLYVIAWSEGSSPNFVIRAQYLVLR